MSIWQNFKEADHYFEKRFLKAIVAVPAGIACWFFIFKIFDCFPDVEALFTNYGKLFLYFVQVFFALAAITAFNYWRTLDWIEAETKSSYKASLFNVVTWTIFWIGWSVFLAWLTYNCKPATYLVQSTIVALVLLPGLVIFIVTENIRQQQLKDEESKLNAHDRNVKSGAHTLNVSKRYYSGYYGLLCLPVYLITLLAERLV